MKSSLKIVIWVSVFAIAMAFIETSVVIYLREIYSPEGFSFPMAVIEKNILITEIYREAATLLLLISMAFIAGKSGIERFAYFIYAFGVWDIFYYVFLKLLLDWPETLFVWDILFLIPVTWSAPVITPIIISLTMMLLAIIIIYYSAHKENVRIKIVELLMFIAGFMLVFISFIWGYCSFILKHIDKSDGLPVSVKLSLFELSFQYVPHDYKWWIFFLGEMILLIGIYVFYRRCSLSMR